MDEILDIIRHNIWIVVPLGFFIFLIIATVTDSFRKTSQTKSREESRRELAAYVAEGSMTADEAERLLASGTKKGFCSRNKA